MAHGDSLVDRAWREDDAHLGQGLLGTRAQWRLPLGLTQAVPLRWGARALLALAALIFLAWAGALFAQALSGSGAWLELTVALVVGVSWLPMILGLWQGLGHQAMVPLRWGGLPLSRPTRNMPSTPPGWSVPGWPHAVSLHVVFDLGPWVLVKMTSSGPGAQPEAWFWVDALLGFQGREGHHLRALLFSSRANEVGLDRPRPADEGTVMASSTDIQRQWSNLLSSFTTAGQDGDQALSRRMTDVHGALVADRDFADTEILDLSHRLPHGGRSPRLVDRGVRS